MSARPFVERRPQVGPDRGWRIATDADDLQEGLFGQVLLWTFEILPWLAARGMRPAWDIRARFYGAAPDGRVLPGVFDPVGEVPARVTRTRSLLWARVRGVHALGGDWAGTHALWTRYFRVPARIEAQADALGLPPATLGLHYRGTDKNQATIDTNPVTVDDFLQLAAAFLAGRPELRTLFVASDEPGLRETVAARFPTLRVLGLGDVPFHKADAADGSAKADRALLDCVLLSRCRAVLKCSSALSGFAKVLNPALECYRVAACKMWSDVPYFPDAYVPRLELADASARAILARLMADDWLDDPRARLWVEPFVARRRHGPWRTAVNALKYGASLLLYGRRRRA